MRLYSRFVVMALLSTFIFSSSFNVARAQDDAPGVMFRGDAARTGEQPGPGPKAEPAETWRVNVDAPVVASPQVVGDTVYVAGWDGVIRALDLATGDERWSFATGSFDSTPAIVDGVVYAGGANDDESAGTLFALDAASGIVIWQHETPYSLADSSPAVVDGVVYIGGGNGDETAGALFAIDAATGALVWQYDTSLPLWSSPAVADGRVVIGGSGVSADSGAVYAVDAETGVERWSLEVVDSPVLSTPAIADGQVFIGTTVLYALDLETGDVNWSKAERGAAFDTSPAVVDGVVYVGGTALSAFVAATGDDLWTNTKLGAYVASPVVARGVVYAGTYDGDVVAVTAKSGKTRWTVSVLAPDEKDDRVITGAPTVINGSVFVGSLSSAENGPGVVHAFQ